MTSQISDIISGYGIYVDQETILKAKSLFPKNEDSTICQRLRWIIEKNMELYRQTKELVYLAMILYTDEAHTMAKKMNDKLVEYKNETHL